MKKRFENQHVVITGAARGIGFEIATQFAREGAVLSLLDFNEENLRKATAILRENGATVYAYSTDVSNRQGVSEVINKADEIQPIDVLINNAGIAAETPFLNIEEAEWK